MAETSVFDKSTASLQPRHTMRAAQVSAPGKVEVVDVEIPQPGPGQVLVRLEGCGVCASNIPPFEGREWFNYPMEPGALGHEGWGVIQALGTGVTQFAIGDRVAALSQHAYAECDVVDENSLVKIPHDLSGPLPGEPLGCAVNIFKRSGIRSGDTVVIVGIGFLGALLTQLAVQSGATVVALARKPYALDVAAKMGAQHTVLMDDHWRVIEQVKQITPETRFADVVIECTGKQWPLDLAAELCKERGRLVIAGYHQDGLRSVNLQLWNWRGLDVINAHEREHQIYIDGIQEAINKVRSGSIKPDTLYTHTFSLEELGRALELTRDRPEGFMKALITFDQQ